MYVHESFCSYHLLTAPLLLSFLVCKDGSCGDGSCVGACFQANIDYVVGPSCTGVNSCLDATIGSVDSSCNSSASCVFAQLSGVDLINSCNADSSCDGANGNEAFDELIDCCNVVVQCRNVDGFDIVAAGCVSYCL